MATLENYLIFYVMEGQWPAFLVEIAPNKTVAHLKELIQAKKRDDFPSIGADKLTLYRVNATGSTLNERRDAVAQAELTNDCELDPVEYLVDIYPKSPPKKTIHVVVQLPPISKKRQRDLEEEEMPRKLRVIVPTASVGAFPEIFKQYALPGKDQIIKCNRPIDTSTIPLALLHGVFGRFIDECESFEPQVKENNFIQSLRSGMAGFFSEEGERQRKFHECFSEAYEIRLLATTTRHTRTTTDGHAFEIGSATSKWVIMITEAKNELAGFTADPRFQAILYYRTQVKTYPTELLKTCCFPAIILTCYAANLQISGVVIHPDGTIQSEVLTSTFPLDADWRNNAIQNGLAKCAGALYNALDGLSRYYNELNPLSMPMKPSKFRFPYQNSYHSIETTAPISFKYIERPFEGESKYPANWNTTGVVRPDGAYDGQLVTKAHDLFMVGELFKREYSGRTLYSTQLPPKSTTEDASRNDKILP